MFNLIGETWGDASELSSKIDSRMETELHKYDELENQRKTEHLRISWDFQS